MVFTQKKREAFIERIADQELIFCEEVHPSYYQRTTPEEFEANIKQELTQHLKSFNEEGGAASRFHEDMYGRLHNNTVPTKSTYRAFLRHDKHGHPYVMCERNECELGIVKSGKFFTHYDRVQLSIYKITKAKELICIEYVNTRHRKGFSTRRVGQLEWESYSQCGSYFPLITKHLGQPKTDLELYPLSEHYGSSMFNLPSETLARFQGTHTVTELTAKLFGKKRVRKDLVKAVAQAHPVMIAIAHGLRHKDVPTDWLVNFLKLTFENLNGTTRSAHNLSAVTRRHGKLSQDGIQWLKGLDTISRRRLLVTDPRKTPIHHIVRMFLDMNKAPTANKRRVITHVESWNDLEQQVLGVRRDIIREEQELSEAKAQRYKLQRETFLASPKGQAYLAKMDERRRIQLETARKREEERRRKEEIHFAKRVEAYNTLKTALLDAHILDDARIVIAESDDADLLREWGKELRNCIGNYAHALKNRSSMLGAIYVNEKLTVNFEIHITSDGSEVTLSQFLGKRNKDTPRHIHDPFIEFFKNHNVGCEKYWGQLPSIDAMIPLAG